MNDVKKRPYYNDLKAYKKSGDKARTETPYTPAIPLFYALQEALHIVKEEGMETRIKRHRVLSEAVRAGAGEMNLEMFPQLNEYSQYSNSVSAMKAPEGIDGEDIKGDMKKRGIIVAGGQERLKGKIFRIGSMGNVNMPGKFFPPFRAWKSCLRTGVTLTASGPGSKPQTGLSTNSEAKACV